ncbi:MAG: electron transport complex subunit E [Candidatus Omnitrophota bacterium]
MWKSKVNCYRDCFKKGLCLENPVFRLTLGLCPTLAVTVTAVNGLSMGLAAMFVLLCSNTIISLFRKSIPETVRIPCYIVIIATFVTVTKLVMQAYLPALYDQLGLFVDIMVVNCIILGRAEAFASRNPVIDSVIDALGMGLGFTLATTVIGAVREVLGMGTIFGFAVGNISAKPVIMMILPPGAFLTIGILTAIFNNMGKKRIKSA